MQKYDFYYDESYQCRAINEKNGDLNIKENTGAEFYIGCFVGCQDWNEINDKILELEKSYKNKMGFMKGGLLKSINLLKQNKLQYGIASLPVYSINFYKSLLQILDNKVKIQFVFFSRYEAIVKEVLPEEKWFLKKGFSYTSVVHYMTKYLIYHPECDIVNILCSDENDDIKIKNIVNILKNLIIKRPRTASTILENNIIKQILYIMNLSDFYIRPLKKHMLWCYDGVALALKLYCSNSEILPENIIIDREKSTLSSMECLFPNALEGASSQYIELRVCDWLAGLFGRLTHKYVYLINDAKNQKNSNKEIFKFDKNKQELISIMYKVLIEQQQNYGAIVSSLYTGEALTLVTFIEYCNRCFCENKEMSLCEFNEYLTYYESYYFNENIMDNK